MKVPFLPLSPALEAFGGMEGGGGSGGGGGGGNNRSGGAVLAGRHPNNETL